MKRICWLCIVSFICCVSVYAEALELALRMPGAVFAPGTRCSVDIDVVNRGGAESDAILVVVLDIGTGNYWFYPNWKQYPPDVDWLLVDLPGFVAFTSPIIEEFIWPEDTGSWFNAAFIAAVFSSEGELISNLPTVQFGWNELPLLDSIIPSTGPPGKLLQLIGRGFNFSSGNVSVAIAGYEFPAISTSVDASGNDVIVTVIPPLESGNYEVRINSNGRMSNPVSLQIDEIAPTGKPVGQVAEELAAGMNELLAAIDARMLPDAVAGGLIPAEAEADYHSVVNRADALFNGFFEEIEALPEEQKKFFESVLIQNGIDAIFAGVQSELCATHARGDVAAGFTCITLDVTSAALTAIDQAWGLVDLAMIITTVLSGGSALPVAGGSFGLHYAIIILDAALDGFFPTDLTVIRLEGVDTTISELVNSSHEYTIQGVFDNQKPPLNATFGMFLTTFLESLGPFISQTELDDAMRNWLIEKLSNFGFSLGEGMMGPDIMNWGDPDPVTLDIDFAYFTSVDLSQLMGLTIFGNIGAIVDLMRQLNMDSFPERGIIIGDPSILRYSLDHEKLILTGKAAGVTSLTFTAFAFRESESWWNLLGLETPAAVSRLMEATVASGPPPVPDNFVLIPAGSFLMGAPSDELCYHPSEGPQHTVTITESFYMQVAEVTQAQWVAVFGENPSYFDGTNLPVETVAWYDACIFANRLSVAAGLTPAYYTDQTFTTMFDGRPPIYNDHTVFWNQNANGFRLPTEAEWEYACRAGKTTPYNNGLDNTVCEGAEDPNLNPLAWYSYTSDTGDGRQPHPGGLKQPNDFGLSDMHGNVWEWCWDWFDETYYAAAPSENPTGPNTGAMRVWRGGSWGYQARYCRSAHRSKGQSTARWNYVGFRLVLPNNH